MEALKYTLQEIYCPPLDSSLLAAFIAELETECKAQNKRTPSKQQIFELKQKLSTIASFAEEQSCCDETGFPLGSPLSEQSSRSISYSSDGTPDWSSGDITTTTCSSEVSYGQMNSSNSGSPLGFLCSIFPHMDVAKLRMEVTRNGDNNIDIEAIVEDLMTNEYILELKERGLDDDILSDLPSVVRNSIGKHKPDKFAPALTAQTPKKHNNRGTRKVITDVRQRQNQPPTPYSPSGSQPPAALDPWSQLTSLATHLATLLPSYSPSYFQSAFHSPQYPKPAMALRSCLTSIADTYHSVDCSLSVTDKTQLFEILDILRDSPPYSQLNSEQRDQILSDAVIALRATRGNPDQALEVVELLLDLDTGLDLGVYHSPERVPSGPRSPITKSRYTSQLPTGPPPTLPPPTSRSNPNSPTIQSKLQSDTLHWQSVPKRNTVQGSNPLTASIPSYNSRRKAKIKGSGNGIGKGGKGDIGELTHVDKMKHLRRGRDEALREATRYWKNGNSRNRGGEVAMYFAERARDYQIQARKEALNVAREMVMSKRVSSANGDTIDLHGTTVSEAIAIVQEILRENPASNTNPLRIITGKGTHSVGKTGVLKPAIKNALVEQGWEVGDFDGWLVVRGRRG